MAMTAINSFLTQYFSVCASVNSALAVSFETECAIHIALLTYLLTHTADIYLSS